MSGFGFYGGKGRCFKHWQEFLECYTNAETEHPKQCNPIAADYYECLHHPKEKARVNAIRAQNLANHQALGVDAPKDYVEKDNIPQVLGLIVSESKDSSK